MPAPETAGFPLKPAHPPSLRMPDSPSKNKFEFNLEDIRSWGGERQYLEALNQYAKKKAVLNPKFENNIGEADINHAGHTIHTRFRTFPGKRSMVENLCPCASSQRDGRICVHMLAAAIGLVLAAREGRANKIKEAAKAAKAALDALPESTTPVPSPPSTPARAATPRGLRRIGDKNAPRLRFYVPLNWIERFEAGEVPIALSVSKDETPVVYSLRDINARTIPFDPTPEEDDLLFTLEHMFHVSTSAASGKNLLLNRKQFCTFLERLGEVRMPFYPARAPQPVAVRSFEDAIRTSLHVALQEETGQLELSLKTYIPGAPETIFPKFLVYRDAENWRNDRVYAFYDGVLWPLRTAIPFSYGDVYYKKSYLLHRDETIDFIRREYRGESPVVGNMKSLHDILGGDFDSQVDFSVFTIKPGSPSFSLVATGSRASIALSLKAHYSGLPTLGENNPSAETKDADDEKAAHAGEEMARQKETEITVDVVRANPAEQFTIPDPKDNFIYYTPTREAERYALAKRAERGLAALGPAQRQDAPSAERRYVLPNIIGDEKVLNFLATTVPTLRRNGWEVILADSLKEYDESLVVVAPRVTIVPHPRKNGFEISYRLASADGSVVLTEAEVSSIPEGVSHLMHNGRMVLFDRSGIDNLDSVINECAAPGSRKKSAQAHRGAPKFLPDTYTHFIKSSIDNLAASGVTLESVPDSWLQEADLSSLRKNLKPAPIGEPARSLLRPYQTTGVAWLRYLEIKGQGGILADEMGLGKTLQTLCWLSLPRVSGSTDPAIVICPTSLVDNWKHECLHFVPEMRVMTMTGTKRHEDFAKIPTCNLIVTSYALIRRDIDEYRKFHFSAVVLDEAQNIKNQNTLNARSVKQLNRDAARLVVTGTPIENSVSDLWSIMDFLMPGYLGPYETFRRSYVEPLQTEDPKSEIYLELSHRLREKVAPFMLRRLKTLVARDLPPKIVRTSWCELSPEQRRVYNRILDESRQQVTGSVHSIGFEKSRMLILTALLRLRQVCCHLSLVDEAAGKQAEEPSAKLEHLFEILEEATSQNHRVLVFSQFVKMLNILREEFTRRKIPFCYIDGATRDRAEQVKLFNSDPSIPVFLISIKAGGTGLNLTGADEVVHFDPWWNPAVEEQATDRAHRIGQQNTVYSLRLITSGTIEERVLQMQRRKRAIIDATVEGDEQTMSKLTWADVKKLLDIE